MRLNKKKIAYTLVKILQDTDRMKMRQISAIKSQKEITSIGKMNTKQGDTTHVKGDNVVKRRDKA